MTKVASSGRTVGPGDPDAAADAFEATRGADLAAIVEHLEDRERVLALLEGMDRATIVAAWTAVRRRVGGDGKPDPVAELTYGLGRDHFTRWPRACLATVGMIPAVDRVVRIIELTTTGFVCAVTDESAWHAYLMAHDLPDEAMVYLREHADGRHFRELVQRTPPEAIAMKRLALGHAPAEERIPARAPWRPEGAGHGMRVERDRSRGLVHATADRIELRDVTFTLGGVALRAQRLEARGVLVDARVATAADPIIDGALLVRVETLAAHGVVFGLPRGDVTCERVDAKGIVVTLHELPGGASAPDAPPAKVQLADIPGEIAASEALEDAVAAIEDMLAEPLVGPILGGTGGGRVAMGGISLRGVAFDGDAARARVVDLGRIDLTIERVPSGVKEAQAGDVAAFLEAYRRQREDGLDAARRERFFAMRKTLEGAVVGEIASVRVVAADGSARGIALAGGRIELGRSLVWARSRALACRHVSRATLVADALDGVVREIAPTSASLDVELALGELALTEGTIGFGPRVFGVVGQSGLRAADVRFIARLAAAGATWSRLTTGAGRCDVKLEAPGRVAADVGLAWAAARIDHGERDTRVSVSDVGSSGIGARALDEGAIASWTRTWPELDVRRVTGAGVEATWLPASRTLAFNLSLGQAQIASCTWPAVAGAPAITGGLDVGATSVRGALLVSPWHLVVEELRLARLEARGAARLIPGVDIDLERVGLEDVRMRGIELPTPRAPRATTLHVARVGLSGVRLAGVSVAVTSSALEIGRGPDGRVTFSSGPIALTGTSEASDAGPAGRGKASLEGLKGTRGRDGMLAVEAASLACDVHLEPSAPGVEGTLDLRVTARTPALVGDPRATLGLRLDGADITLEGRREDGPRAVSGRLEARGVTTRADLSLGVSWRLVLRTATWPRAQLDDVRVRWPGGELGAPQVRFERTEVRDVVIVRDDGRARVTDGSIKSDGVAIDRGRLALDARVEAAIGSWRSSMFEVKLAPITRMVGLGDVQIGGLALATASGRVELATLRLSELAVEDRQGDVHARARSAIFRIGGAPSTRTSEKRSGRATLDFLDHMHGEIGITVPIGNERITGQLVVEPHGVDIAPTLVASHALQDQYWGWAPRWLASRMVVSATRYVADFFERELAAMRRRIGARLEGVAGTKPTRIDSGVVAQQLVDAMVRWSAAVDVLTPRGRGPLGVIGDPTEQWLAAVATEATDMSRDKRLEDIGAWARAIGLAVGIQATGEARIDVADAGPRLEARVGARLSGAGTLGGGLHLSLGANLSHIGLVLGELELRADTASLDDATARGSQAEAGVGCTVIDLTLRSRARPD